MNHRTYIILLQKLGFVNTKYHLRVIIFFQINRDLLHQNYGFPNFLKQQTTPKFDRNNYHQKKNTTFDLGLGVELKQQTTQIQYQSPSPTKKNKKKIWGKGLKRSEITATRD